MIVVDTSVIAYLYLEGEFTKNAEVVLKFDPHWVAPLLWRSEFRNILALYLRKKIITYRTALEIIEQAEDLLDDNEYEVVSEQILHLVQQSNCSAYDCEFVYLARKLDVSLVTADKKVFTAFPENCISLATFK